MRVLILYANPVATSFGAALHQQAVKALQASGHDIDDCDLYAERFDPILVNKGEFATIISESTASRSPTMPIDCWRQKRSFSFIRFGMKVFRRF